ncbi:MAG: M24 family metallopeptidase [Fimbriimonadaceae bacterium]|nr:M24 family metallopeptidase [Fimbriimonadaceae bacterium]
MGVEARQAKAAAAWNLTDEIVVVGAGDPQGRPGYHDQCYPYVPHTEYRWLTDCRREGGIVAYDPKTGWAHFEPPVSEAECVWGPGPAPVGRPVAEFGPWLEERAGRPLAALGCYADPHADPKLSETLSRILHHVRRPKDAGEVALMRRAAAATLAGYEAIRRAVRPGVTERDIQIEFEYAIAKAGADGPGYASIVGAGPDSAVFHLTPGARALQEGDFLLVDAGAEVEGYVVDVTRTFACGGLTDEKAKLQAAVVAAEKAGVAACTAGREWHDVHALCARRMAEALVDLKVLRVSPDEAVAGGVMSLFFPHGVGHTVGLGVRDAMAQPPGLDRDRTVAGVRVRIDMPLEVGYAVTVEPGCYFNPALLTSEERRAKWADQVDFDRATAWLGHGGCRCEDTVVVTDAAPLNLTEAIPYGP